MTENKDKSKTIAMMDYLGEGKIYRTPSSTRLNVSHITIVHVESGEATCTCEGFRSHNKCWHVTAVSPEGNDSDDWIVSGLDG